jgi:hypothetical protein
MDDEDEDDCDDLLLRIIVLAEIILQVSTTNSVELLQVAQATLVEIVLLLD